MVRDTTQQLLTKAAADCVDCGECASRCNVLADAGLTIGTMASSLADRSEEARVRRAVFRCALCGFCCVDCPAGIDAHAVTTAGRELLAAVGALVTQGRESMLVDRDVTLFGLYREAEGISYDDLAPGSHDVVFFPGCILATFAPDLTRRTHAWLAEHGIRADVSGLCCGSPLRSLGLAKRAETLGAYIAAEFAAAGVKRVVTVCPGCQAELSAHLPGIEVTPLAVLMRAQGVALEGLGPLTVHDACPDRTTLEIGTAVRDILADHELVEMEHHGRNSLCCGSGGMVSSLDPPVYHDRMRARIDEYRATGAHHMVTACVTCSYALSMHSRPGEVLHYLELVFGMRIDWPDVHAKARALWQGELGRHSREKLAHAHRFGNSQDEGESAC